MTSKKPTKADLAAEVQRLQALRRMDCKLIDDLAFRVVQLKRQATGGAW